LLALCIASSLLLCSCEKSDCTSNTSSAEITWDITEFFELSRDTFETVGESIYADYLDTEEASAGEKKHTSSCQKKGYMTFPSEPYLYLAIKRMLLK